MASAAYNLEHEQLNLESYLERTTVVSVAEKGRQGCDGYLSTTKSNCDVDNDDGGGDEEFIEKRVFCCNTSRSLYCPECCKVLIPRRFWPKSLIRNQNDEIGRTGRRRRLRRPSFPFQSMDIVLGVKERRTSSTGIQLVAISNMIAESIETSLTENAHNSVEVKQDIDVPENDLPEDCQNEYEWWNNVKLYDLNQGDMLPLYSNPKEGHEKVNNEENDDDKASPSTAVIEGDGTFVLFPQEGKSVPMSAVADKIKRLVVLDIKWTRSYNVQLFSADHHKILVSQPKESGGGKSYNPLSPLKDLPFVHLEFPPQKSHFWRWHNRGDGMLSTIEAIYFAAREVFAALEQQQRDFEMKKIAQKNRQPHHGLDDDDGDDYDENNSKDALIDILWLFALQRSIIQERSLREGRPVAFSEEAKELARALRKQGPSPTARKT